MRNQHHRRGLLASAGALATAAALVLGGAVAASANPTILPTETTGNLNITKLSTPDGGAGAANIGGAPVASPGGTGVEGVTFTVTRVAPGPQPGTDLIDLSTNEGWLAAADAVLDLSDPDNPEVLATVGGSALDLGAPETGYTDANGVPHVNPDGTGAVSFQSLDIGLYLVQETSTPAGVIGSAPFLVTIPMTNAAGTDWNYNVHVYPKNSVTDITKTVSDPTQFQAGTAGALITWTIFADVPRIANESTPGTFVNPSSFVITDQLDDRLDPQEVRVHIVDAAGDPIVAGQLDAGDYNVTPDPLEEGANLTITFSPSGLAKLGIAAGTVGNDVRVEIDTLVLTPDGIGTIENNASVNINNEGAVTTTTPATTVWSSFNFDKTRYGVDDDPGTPTVDESALPGAQFQVYAKDPRGASTQPGTSNPALLGTAAVSATNGSVAINGLPLSSHLNNAAISDPADYRVYWLTEVKAPSGYELLAEPIPFVLLSTGAWQITVDSNGKPVTVDNSGTIELDNPVALNEIENVETNAGFVLPLTGGMGTAVLTIAGAAILAVVLLLVVRRRRDTEASAE